MTIKKLINKLPSQIIDKDREGYTEHEYNLYIQKFDSRHGETSYHISYQEEIDYENNVMYDHYYKNENLKTALKSMYDHLKKIEEI